MAKESKTAKASAVKEAPKAKFVWTQEAAIAEVRRSRDAKLFIGNMDLISHLLNGYDGNNAALSISREGERIAKERLQAVSEELIAAHQAEGKLLDRIQRKLSTENSFVVFSGLDHVIQCFENLIDATNRVYNAAYWISDRPLENEAKLWENLRDAAGIEPGHSPKRLETTADGESVERVQLGPDGQPE